MRDELMSRLSAQIDIMKSLRAQLKVCGNSNVHIPEARYILDLKASVKEELECLEPHSGEWFEKLFESNALTIQYYRLLLEKRSAQ